DYADDSDKISSALCFGVLPQLWVTKRPATNIHVTLSLISNIFTLPPRTSLVRRPGYDLFNQHAAACQNSLCSLRSPMKTVFLPVSASNTSMVTLRFLSPSGGFTPL